MTDSSFETSFQRELIDSAHWDDLAQVIVRYPSRVAAADSVHLFVRDSRGLGFSYVAHWSKDGASPAYQLPDKLMSHCRRCLEASTYRDLVLESCSKPSGSQEELSVVRYCAPLVFRKKVIAILLINFAANIEPSSQQILALTRVLPDMSLAIASFQLQRSVLILADEAESSRQHIAQDLHDSLAHTIGYLRLKLNQFSMDGAQLELVESQAHIERMREAADEAYELIRHTLAELEPACAEDLAKTLLEQATVIGQRGGLEVRMTSTCEPIPVAPEVQRQALYICREALNNTSKHARAQRVEIDLHWGKGCFALRITDDGIGFDPDEVTFGDHFGLAIMKQRAQSVGGTLTIHSCRGKGTQIFLWSPTALTRVGPY